MVWGRPFSVTLYPVLTEVRVRQSHRNTSTKHQSYLRSANRPVNPVLLVRPIQGDPVDVRLSPKILPREETTV